MRTHQMKATGNADHSTTAPTIDQDKSSLASCVSVLRMFWIMVGSIITA